jgi:hypothetical protein
MAAEGLATGRRRQTEAAPCVYPYPATGLTNGVFGYILIAKDLQVDEYDHGATVDNREIAGRGP